MFTPNRLLSNRQSNRLFALSPLPKPTESTSNTTVVDSTTQLVSALFEGKIKSDEFVQSASSISDNLEAKRRNQQKQDENLNIATVVGGGGAGVFLGLLTDLIASDIDNSIPPIAGAVLAAGGSYYLLKEKADSPLTNIVQEILGETTLAVAESTQSSINNYIEEQKSNFNKKVENTKTSINNIPSSVKSSLLSTATAISNKIKAIPTEIKTAILNYIDDSNKKLAKKAEATKEEIKAVPEKVKLNLQAKAKTIGEKAQALPGEVILAINTVITNTINNTKKNIDNKIKSTKSNINQKIESTKQSIQNLIPNSNSDLSDNPKPTISQTKTSNPIVSKITPTVTMKSNEKDISKPLSKPIEKKIEPPKENKLNSLINLSPVATKPLSTTPVSTTSKSVIGDTIRRAVQNSQIPSTDGATVSTSKQTPLPKPTTTTIVNATPSTTASSNPFLFNFGQTKSSSITTPKPLTGQNTPATANGKPQAVTSSKPAVTVKPPVVAKPATTSSTATSATKNNLFSFNFGESKDIAKPATTTKPVIPTVTATSSSISNISKTVDSKIVSSLTAAKITPGPVSSKPSTAVKPSSTAASPSENNGIFSFNFGKSQEIKLTENGTKAASVPPVTTKAATTINGNDKPKVAVITSTPPVVIKTPTITKAVVTPASTTATTTPTSKPATKNDNNNSDSEGVIANIGTVVTYNARCYFQDDLLTPFEIAYEQRVKLGEGDVVPGLELSLRHSKVKEIFLVKCSSRFCYGSIGRPAVKDTVNGKLREIKNIPPNQDLQFEVEVLSHRLDSELMISQHERDTLTDAQLRRLYALDELSLRKEAGNRWFSYQDFARASRAYSKGTQVADTYFKSLPGANTTGIEGMIEPENQEVPPMSKEEIEADKPLVNAYVACLNNLSACHLQTGEYLKVKDMCIKVLEFDPNNVKALLRAAKATLALDIFEECEACLKQVFLIDPDNPAGKLELAKLRKAQKDYNNKSKEISKNIAKKLFENKNNEQTNSSKKGIIDEAIELAVKDKNDEKDKKEIIKNNDTIIIEKNEKHKNDKETIVNNNIQTVKPVTSIPTNNNILLLLGTSIIVLIISAAIAYYASQTS
eukprot:gene9352-12602_t